ncbi:hypothetical protein JADG_009259 [Aureobasidium aubasidani]|nr:hypothetical protein JADG_009259 [Aureobasidium pullulans]
MPSNTSHIQKRDQLNQHPDLVLGTNDWQEPDQHLGFPTDFETRPAPQLKRERRQRSSDSLEKQQKPPKQPKIDFEHLRQRFKKLTTSTTETVPRGMAAENTLPRFRPERVYYTGCRPFLEG